MKLKKNVVIIFLVIALVLGTLAGCTNDSNKQETEKETSATEQKEETKEVLTAEEAPTMDELSEFEHYWDLSWMNKNDTDIKLELEKRTNCKVNYTSPISDDGQKLNVMMASGALPEVITAQRTQPAVATLIEAGAVYALDELINEYAPSIWENVAPEYFQFYKHDDGKNYFFTNYLYSSALAENPNYPKIEPVTVGSSVRTDIWEAIGKPDISTPEKYAEMLRLIKAEYPNLPTLYFPGFTSQGGLFNSTDSPAHGFFGEWGIHLYDASADGSVTSVVRNPKFFEMISWMNGLYNEGLLDAQSFIDDREIASQKMDNGQVAVMHAQIGNHAFADGVNYTQIPYFDDMDGKFVKSGSGWLATMITKDAADDIEGIMRWFEYCASLEGRQLISWGFEDKHWIWNPENSGEPIQTEIWDNMEYADQFTDEWGFWQNSALHDQLYCNMLFEKNTDERLEWLDIYGDIREIDLFDGVRNPIQNDSEEGLLLTKLYDLSYAVYPQMIMAKSTQELTEIYDAFIAKADEIGLKTLESIWTEKWDLYN